LGKPEGEWPLGKPNSRWEDNMKMDIKEIGLESVTGLVCFRKGKAGGLL
jgi:hypothetical protein